MGILIFAITLLAVSSPAIFFLRPRFTLMKASCILLISISCLLGLGTTINMLATAHWPTAPLTFAWSPVLPLQFTVDPLTAFFMLPVFGITMMGAIYSFHYLSDARKTQRIAINYCFYGLLGATMLMVLCSNNMITLALSWELMSLSSAWLVLYDFEDGQNQQAGYLYLIFSQTGAMFIFVGLGLIYAWSGSLSFSGLTTLPAGIRFLSFILLLIGFGSKAGILPLHIWLPHAHPAAPSHVSALMSGVMIKMGIYGIIRFYTLLHPDAMICGGIILVCGVITGVLGVVYAIGQSNLKRLLAYSSVENIGIILIGLGIGMIGQGMGNQRMAWLGFTGTLLHVLNHSIFKSLLFMGAGAIQHSCHTLNIEQLGGLMKKMRISGLTFLAGAIAICGLPPFNGFISEFLIYSASFNGATFNNMPFLLAILGVVSLATIGGLAAACFAKVVGVVWLGEPRTEAAANPSQNGITMIVPMIILAVTTLVIGLAPRIFIRTAAQGTAVIIGTPGGLDTATGVASKISLSFGLLLLILTILFFLRRTAGAKSTSSSTWGCGYTQPTPRMQYTGSSFAASIIDFYHNFVPLTENFSKIHGVFPQPATYKSQVIDLSESFMTAFIAQPVIRFITMIRRLQHGNIQLYIAYIVLAIISLLLWLIF